MAPQVVERPNDLEARRNLLEGARHAEQLSHPRGSGSATLAQALGGTVRPAHGAMNALSLPGRFFQQPVAGAEIARFGNAMGTDDPIGRVEEQRLGGFERLRDFGVPETELEEVAEPQGSDRALRRAPGGLTARRTSTLCGSGPTRPLPTVHGPPHSPPPTSRPVGLTASHRLEALVFLIRPGCFHAHEDSLKGRTITRKEEPPMEFRILGPLESSWMAHRSAPRATSPVPCSGCSSCIETGPSRPSS
jgi:hypothetical protein